MIKAHTITMHIEFYQEKIIPIQKGDTILNAALNASIPHYHACGGFAKCSTCRVLVLEGDENLERAKTQEIKLTSSLKLPPMVRLACQTKMIGGFVKVERMIKGDNELSAMLKPTDQKPGKFDLRPMGEEKNLILFFLDVRNFAPFVDAYLPFDVIYLVRKLFELFHRVITEHRGEIIETAGDGLYAIFGESLSEREASVSAVACAFQIHTELKKLNKNYAKLFSKEFEIGIGIHCGKVIVGDITYGGNTRKIAMGRAVVIASRIEDSTKHLNNSILVSEDILRLSGYQGISKLSILKLIGVTMPIPVYAIGEAYEKLS